MSEQLKELPAVARNINLPCKKCGVDRYFVVVAHTSPTSAKVKCEVCGAQKTFKLETEKKAKASTGSKTPRKTASKKPDYTSVWNDLKTQIGVDNILPYEMRRKYPMAAAIQHPKFGIGFVTNSFSDKVEVAFEDGARSLVHNRG